MKIASHSYLLALSLFLAQSCSGNEKYEECYLKASLLETGLFLYNAHRAVNAAVHGEFSFDHVANVAIPLGAVIYHGWHVFGKGKDSDSKKGWYTLDSDATKYRAATLGYWAYRSYFAQLSWSSPRTLLNTLLMYTLCEPDRTLDISNLGAVDAFKMLIGTGAYILAPVVINPSNDLGLPGEEISYCVKSLGIWYAARGFMPRDK